MKFEYTVTGDETGWKTLLKLDGKTIYAAEKVKSNLGYASKKTTKKDELEDDLYYLVDEIEGAGHTLALYARDNS